MFMHLHPRHCWPPGTSLFLEVILGLPLGDPPPPLCDELICSVPTLIIYGEDERSGVLSFLFVELVFSHLLL